MNRTRQAAFCRTELANAAELLGRTGRIIETALAEAHRLESRGYPAGRDANTNGTPAGGHSDPTAAQALAGQPGCQPADPYNNLDRQIEAKTREVNRAVTDLANLTDLALANADVLNTCIKPGCNVRVSGNRDDRLIKGLCRRCYGLERRSASTSATK